MGSFRRAMDLRTKELECLSVKKLALLLLLAMPVMASGPKYIGATTDQQVAQEFYNVYQDLRNTSTSASAASVPTGSIFVFASSNAPSGYYSCDGSTRSRTTDSALFTAIGTTWGIGDGSSTFNLPNLTRRTVVVFGGSGTSVLGSTVGALGGEETHTLASSEVPATGVTVVITDPGHVHSFHEAFDNALTDNKVAFGARGNGATNQPNQVISATTGITAAGTVSGGGGSHNNIQPSAVIMFIIKS